MKKFEFPALPEMQMNFIPKPAKLQQVLYTNVKWRIIFFKTLNFTSISPTKHNIFWSVWISGRPLEIRSVCNTNYVWW